MEEKQNGEKISPVVKRNIFLRKVTTEVEQKKTISLLNMEKVKKIFSKKCFKGIEKCCFELIIAMGTSENPELESLAKELNLCMNNAKK